MCNCRKKNKVIIKPSDVAQPVPVPTPEPTPGGSES